MKQHMAVFTCGKESRSFWASYRAELLGRLHGADERREQSGGGGMIRAGELGGMGGACLFDAGDVVRAAPARCPRCKETRGP